jgi:sterol desaturase/sphingolipid hydroxylase (fatty acid hydroxylase superfamily)
MRPFTAIRALRRSDPLAGPLPGWVNALAIGGTLATMWWLERRRPLRRQIERKGNHDARNLGMAALSAVAIRIAEKPITDRLSRLVHDRRFGLVKWAKLPVALEVSITVILLDYTLYLWHVLTHRLRFLWRFHRVHHADLDLTTSTALRFHFAEMVLSVPWRATQVLLLGAAPLSFSIWQTITLAAILFHHSNIDLPLGIERWLCRVVMTPRMHGIHHSIVPAETDSNWSTIFTLADYLHGTYRLNVPQALVTIGVPEYRDAKELRVSDVIAMPFGQQRPFRRFPGDGTSERTGLPLLPPGTLAS